MAELNSEGETMTTSNRVGKEKEIGLPPPVLDLTPGVKPDGSECNHNPNMIRMWFTLDPTTGEKVISARCHVCMKLLAGTEPKEDNF